MNNNNSVTEKVQANIALNENNILMLKDTLEKLAKDPRANQTCIRDLENSIREKETTNETLKSKLNKDDEELCSNPYKHYKMSDIVAKSGKCAYGPVPEYTYTFDDGNSFTCPIDLFNTKMLDEDKKESSINIKIDHAVFNL